MNITCAPRGFVGLRHPRQGIGDIEQAKFEQIMLDMTMACSPEELEDIEKICRKQSKIGYTAMIARHPEKLYEFMKPVTEQCADRELRCSIAMAPYLPENTKRNDQTFLLAPLVKESIQICRQAGCRLLIVKPLSAGEGDEENWRQNEKYYLELAEYAKDMDVKILLTNRCRDLNGHLIRGIGSDGRMAAKWIDRLNEQTGEECFGFCMDVGICSLCGQNMYDFILSLGSRIKAVILRDCSEDGRGSLLPFTSVKQGQSQTDWLNVVRGLRQIGFDGELVMDLQDTAFAFSPLLRPQLAKMANSIAEYLKWQIEIENLLKRYPHRVLFGAGNMCRNYMKCYGDKYPPIYTCDNNRNLWNTEFCGLTVKSPDALLKLPEDCAVFICNIYYREIEAQIREMGIKNPIVFFNDEYMPTFYFDRVAPKEMETY